MSHSELINIVWANSSLSVLYVTIILGLLIVNRPNIKPVAIMFAFTYIAVWVGIPCYKYVEPFVTHLISSL